MDRLKIILIILVTLVLYGCHPFVKYPLPPAAHPEAIGGATVGLGLGVIADAPIAGFLVGGAIGTHAASEIHWLKRLQKDHVQVVQIGDHVRLIVPSDKIFYLNSADIIPRRYPILDDVTCFIEKYGSTPITVSGYSDSVGSTISKLNLTTRQAKSVAAFLWSHGIPYENLRAIGHGSTHFVANNYTPLGSYYNRRIEITFPALRCESDHHGCHRG